MRSMAALAITIALVTGAGDLASGQNASPSRPPASQIAPQAPGWCHQLPRPEYKSLERVPVESDWFEVYRIRPGVFALYEPRQQEEVISYLILGERSALLFDTGLGIGDIRGVVRQLTTLPVSVLNSHTHFDHVGGNADFNDVLAMDTDFTRHSAQGNPLVYQEVFGPGSLCGLLPKNINPATFALRPFHISRIVRDGESIEVGGRSLRVVAAPGHTPDSLCLWDEANGLLFTGDTFYPGPIYLFAPETSLPDYFSSVAKLAALAPRLRLLLPGHNVPVAEPVALTRLKRAVDALQAGAAPVPQRTEDGWLYPFDGFGLLLAQKYPAR